MTPGRTPATVSSGGAPGSTPLRDKLGINEEEGSALLTPRTRAEQQRLADLKSSLRQGLSSLPAPKRDYEIIAPELEQEEADERRGPAMELDRADIDAQHAEQRRLTAEEAEKRRPAAARRGLPHPTTIADTPSKEARSDEDRADELIKQEMLLLLRFEQGAASAGSAPELIEDSDLEAAKALLSAETAAYKAGLGVASDAATAEELARVWESVHEDIFYVPAQARYGRRSLYKKKDHLESLDHELNNLREHMTREFKKAAKLEKKLAVLLGGYQKRAETQRANIVSLAKQAEDAAVDMATFERLRLAELNAIPTRMEVRRCGCKCGCGCGCACAS